MADKKKSSKKKKRVPVAIHCTVCNSQNYVVLKNSKAEYDFKDLMKHCQNCRKHTPHKEKKIPKPS